MLPASDGEAALDLISSYDPRLCLLDAALPLRSGWEILREVRDAPHRAPPGGDPVDSRSRGA